MPQILFPCINVTIKSLTITLTLMYFSWADIFAISSGGRISKKSSFTGQSNGRVSSGHILN